MEIADILIGFIVLLLVLGIGLGTMIWAYVGSGSTSILFPDPISILDRKNGPSLDSMEEIATTTFNRGTDAYKQKKYRQAIEDFTACIDRMSSLAEAYHNRGLAFANLYQDREAVENLVKAGELYAEGNYEPGLRQIRQHLEILQTRK
ncbi:hypothetical protein IQ235_07515 [Oscillatoriales cyanobacterium LEGE 11467]|uniref:Tetratricopeptide repeat protein n=1 Tax=Zarconia navalis LEGE 11467 TaxID=1828826 RepID=A0A928Z6Q3_9CYAN|nr:hypothetical protein [Zarconia navalis]MBE9040627.1 hypothetical protein [Zarconia navalis LEGE 11467]